MESTPTLSSIPEFSFWRLAFSWRMVATLLLGFSSGLPFALVGTTLQAWYTVSGTSLAVIGSLTLIGQPYVYKFLWAPLFDHFPPGFLGRRRGWILLMQIALAAGLATMAMLNPHTSPFLLSMIALIVAIFSATQDINIDGYRTDLLTAEERGLGSAMVTTGYRVAMLVSGGLAMALAAEWGWRTVYLLMANLILLHGVVAWYGPEPDYQPIVRTVFYKTLLNSLKDFLSRPFVYWILIFIILYKLGDAFVLSLGTAFLIRGLKFTLLDVGLIYKTVGMVATLLGAFLGGLWMTRLSLYRALLYFGILQLLANLPFVLLALVGKNYSLMAMAIFTESFCSGLGTVAFMAFIMTLCNVQYSATQYALLSAFAAVGRTFIGPIAGLMMVHMSWAQFYVWGFLSGIPGLLLLIWLKEKVNFSAPRFT